MTHSDLSLPGQVPLPQRRRPHRPGVKHISLALQGGGSHGAFTWGVMHRLISEPRIYIDGISGTSAGAMNGVVFAGGFIAGGRQGAIDALAGFWDRIADLSRLRRSFIRGIPGPTDGWRVDNDLSFMLVDYMTHLAAQICGITATSSPLILRLLYHRGYDLGAATEHLIGLSNTLSAPLGANLDHRKRAQRALRLPIIPNLSMPIGGKT